MSRTASLTLFTIGVCLAFGRVLVGCTPLPKEPAQRSPVAVTTPAPTSSHGSK